MALRRPNSSPKGLETTIDNVLNNITNDLIAKKKYDPMALYQYLYAEKYSELLDIPELKLVGNNTVDKPALVFAILVHLVKNYGVYSFSDYLAKDGDDEKKFQTLQYFFLQLKRAFLDPVDITCLIYLIDVYKYSSRAGYIFRYLNPFGDVNKQDLFDMKPQPRGAVLGKQDWNLSIPWLTPQWISGYCTKVYKHKEIRAMIHAGLKSGGYANVQGDIITFPEIEIIVVTGRNLPSSGFTGVNKYHIIIDELVQETIKAVDKAFNQLTTTEQEKEKAAKAAEKAAEEALENLSLEEQEKEKAKRKPKIEKPKFVSPQALEQWLKLQLLTTTIHELSHTILRANYGGDLNISTPRLMGSSYPESGYLAQNLFCRTYFGAPEGTACDWGKFIFDPRGPIQNKEHPEFLKFASWYSWTISDAVESGYSFHKYVDFYNGTIANFPATYFEKPALTHVFNI